MKFLTAICGGMLLAGAFAARAQSPDEKYVTVYNLIQEGDAHGAVGEARQAASKYFEAQTLLKTFPTLYPGWNEKVVGYRLNYLATKLGPLASNLPAMTLPEAPPAAAAPATATNQVNSLQEDLARLSRENASLQAKLKEALSVQPAATDPRELAKAEEKIKQLQKEIDLLKVSLEQAQAKPAKVSETNAPEQERQLVAGLKQKLQQQMDMAAGLQKENEILKTQVGELKAQTKLAASSPPSAPPEELRIAQTTIAALQATNISLKTDKILLETRLAEITKAGAPAATARIKALTKERDDLKQKLAVATKELNRKKNRAAVWKTDDLARQLETVLARLDVYEAKAVPYTMEEQALFKLGGTNVAVNVPDAEKVTVRELPAGAGPLIAEAERAAANRRFDEAEKLYQQVLRQDENHIFTLDKLAMIQIRQDRLDDAEKTIRRALSLDPKEPTTLFLLGHLKFKQDKFDEALDALSLSAKLKPEEAWTQFYLGQTLIQKGDRPAAETALRKALQLRPGWIDAHHALALVYATQQPPFKELALWHYGKAKDGGYPRDESLEKLLEEKPATSSAPQ